MRTIAARIWLEPAVASAIPTILLGTAAGIWTSQWLAFGAAASAALAALFTRRNVSPIYQLADPNDPPIQD